MAKQPKTKETPAATEETVEQVKAEAAEMIDSLTVKLEQAEVSKSAASTPVVKHNGVSYRVTIQKFSFEGKEHTAADLKGELLDKLVEIGFGGLEKIK